jgi:hypothetical protein|tara:strand:- start:934 stop:1104 length:171 start_codon:yes stop_codon:yes gene_type:complete
MTDEIDDRLIADIQTNMVMDFLEQGLVKEAENKLEEFGLTKKEIKKTLNQYKKEKK